MSKYKYALYKESKGNFIEIKPDEYVEETHSGHLVCPECKEAELHCKNNSNKSWFSTNPSSSHEEDCYYVVDLITDKIYLKLLDKEDKNKYLMSNLRKAFNLLLDYDEENGKDENIKNKEEKQEKEKQEKKNSLSEVANKHLPRIKIDRIEKEEDIDFFGDYKIFYGRSEFFVEYKENIKKINIHIINKHNVTFYTSIDIEHKEKFLKEGTHKDIIFSLYGLINYRNNKYIHLALSRYGNLMWRKGKNYEYIENNK